MEVIAERTMELELPGETAKRVIRVVVGKPEPGDGGEDWFVPYEIHGPDPGEVARRAAFGVDALQALGAVVHILTIELESLDRRGRLTQNGEPGIWISVRDAKDADPEPE